MCIPDNAQNMSGILIQDLIPSGSIVSADPTTPHERFISEDSVGVTVQVIQL